MNLKNFSRGFKIVFFVFIVLLLNSCIFYKRWYEEYKSIGAVNWTPENKIMFTVLYEKIEKTKNRLTGEEWISGGEGNVTLWEVDTNQNYRRLGEIFNEPYRFSYLSVAGNWVLLSGEDMYAIRRDLSEKRYLGKGVWADLSPDGKKFVYVKPDVGGLWIRNIDGTGDHVIVNDPKARYPVWSPDGGRIAYLIHTSGDFGYLFICDTVGVFLDSITIEVAYPDWGPLDSNAVSGNGVNLKCLIVKLGLRDIISLSHIGSGGGLKWSPEGSWFIAYDGKWYVIKRSGINKWYIKKP